VYCQEPDYNQKYIIIPAKSQWFNLNQIHEIEKKALPEWFKTKKVVFGAVVICISFRNLTNSRRIKNYTRNIETILLISQGINIFLPPVPAKVWLAILAPLSEYILFWRKMD
jgi:hypothetical protein